MAQQFPPPNRRLFALRDFPEARRERALKPPENRLLSSLPAPVYNRLKSHLEWVWLKRGEPIYSRHQSPTYLYFPLDCLISKVFVMRDGSTGQVAIIGNDGCVGMDLIMGGEHTSTETIVLYPGRTFRLPAKVLKEEFARTPHLQQVLLRYVQSLLIYVAQTASCNRHHSIEQQTCRWLLESLDRSPSTEVQMTHRVFATFLGVSREQVNKVARGLRDAGLISYDYGRLRVRDRAGLEARSCECYQSLRAEAARLLSI